jgi:NAD(P)-dependent dehydrogenase (short-subunit alcohol dehydrogenase family)
MAATADCRRQSKQRRRLGAICAALLEPSPLGANSSRRLVTGPATPGEGFATMDLSGRVALVTGGGQGLGGTIALAMARAGADVVLSYSTSGDRAMAIGEEILGMGRRAVAFQADVGDTAQCTALAEKAEKAYGQIDILISNAGMGQGNGVVNTTDDEWDRTMNVNARATFALARCLLPGMVSRKFGEFHALLLGATL